MTYKFSSYTFFINTPLTSRKYNLKSVYLNNITLFLKTQKDCSTLKQSFYVKVKLKSNY